MTAPAFSTTKDEACAVYKQTMAYAGAGFGQWVQYGQPRPSVGLPPHELILYGNPNYDCPSDYYDMQRRTADAHDAVHGAGRGEIYLRLNGTQYAMLDELDAAASVNARNPLWWQYWQPHYTVLESAHRRGERAEFAAGVAAAIRWLQECPLAKRFALYQAALIQTYHHGFTAGRRGRAFLDKASGHMFVPDAFASNLVALPLLLAALRHRPDAAGPSAEDAGVFWAAMGVRGEVSSQGRPTNQVGELATYLTRLMGESDTPNLPHTRGVALAVFEAYITGVLAGRVRNVDGLEAEAFADHADIAALAAEVRSRAEEIAPMTA